MFGNTKNATEKEKSIYYPLLASENLDGGANSADEIKAIWSRFGVLSAERKNILVSDELPEKVKELQGRMKCDDASIEGFSVLIRWFFFDEIDQSGLQGGLQDIFGTQAQQVYKFIQNEILTIRPQSKAEEALEEEASKHVATMVKLPLLQALSKYEQLGNQLITEERIKLRSQSETVRPSLLYWIKYYRDELGVGHHDSVQRGNFLFRSENGKKLSPEERERVNLVLKSVEENYPVEIDTEQSIIIFPAFVAQPAPAQSSQMSSQPQPPLAPQRASFQPNSSAVFRPVPPAPQPGTLSFSTKHVLPAEKESAPVPRPALPPRGAAGVAPQKSNPFHIRPVSLGKEEE